MIHCLWVAEGPIADGALVAVAVEVLGTGASPRLLTADNRGECCWQRGMPPERPAASVGDKSRTGRPTKKQSARGWQSRWLSANEASGLELSLTCGPAGLQTPKKMTLQTQM